MKIHPSFITRTPFYGVVLAGLGVALSLVLGFTPAAVNADMSAVLPLETNIESAEPDWHCDADHAGSGTEVLLSQLQPPVQWRLLRQLTQTRINTAVTTPSVENVTRARQIQQFWQYQAEKKSSMRGQAGDAMLFWLPASDAVDNRFDAALPRDEHEAVRAISAIRCTPLMSAM